MNPPDLTITLACQVPSQVLRWMNRLPGQASAAAICVANEQGQVICAMQIFPYLFRGSEACVAEDDAKLPDRGAQLYDGQGALRGSVAVNAHNRDQSPVLEFIAGLYLTDPAISDRVVWECLRFRPAGAHHVSPQLLSEAQGRLDLAPFGLSSQAGLSALRMGAGQADCLPGGYHGWPDVIEVEPEPPRPGQELITAVPGHGGGLTG